jgi:hypothetical protein
MSLKYDDDTSHHSVAINRLYNQEKRKTIRKRTLFLVTWRYFTQFNGVICQPPINNNNNNNNNTISPASERKCCCIATIIEIIKEKWKKGGRINWLLLLSDVWSDDVIQIQLFLFLYKSLRNNKGDCRWERESSCPVITPNNIADQQKLIRPYNCEHESSSMSFLTVCRSIFHYINASVV